MQYIYNGWNNLPKFITLSAAVHILVIGILMYLSALAPVKRFISPVYTVDLLGPIAVRPKEAEVKPVRETKEIETMPLPVEEPKPIIQPKEEVKEPKKVPKPKKAVLKKGVEEIDIAIEKLEAKVKKEDEEEAHLQRSIKGFKTELDIQKRIEELKKEIEKSEASAKNLVEIKSPVKGADPASMVTGKITQELIELENKAYYSRLKETIYSNWTFPNDSKKNMMAIISIKISKSGNLMEKWFEMSSGNPAFDNSMIRAIEKSAPFPPPPDTMEENFFTEGIGVCFGFLCKKEE